MQQEKRAQTLQQLQAKDLKKILLDPQSLYRQYQTFFLHNGVQLYFTDAKLDELVHQALLLGGEVQGLNALLEEAVAPLLLHLAAGRLQRR